MSQEPPDGDYTIKHKFRIDGSFLYDDFERTLYRLRVEHVDTENPYRMLGLARQGFEYLKTIAIESTASFIYGDMDSGTKEKDELSSFYRKMGYELSFEVPKGLHLL